MKITFLGTGVSVPYERRAQSSILIEDDEKILVDAGIGAMLRLEEAGVGVSEIHAICITHHHLDHNGDLFNILKARWLLGCDSVKIFGPKGTKAFIESTLETYPYLRGKLSFEICEEGKFRIGGLDFEAVPTYHSIESRGYLIDNALAISGDTRAFREFLSLECDVMIHELSLPFNYVADFHTTPENLKEFLEHCRAEKLYLTHLYPMTHAVKDEILEYINFDAVIASDLMFFKV
jgi:ribonuclease BN (tRNA processing enzyme)